MDTIMNEYFTDDRIAEEASNWRRQLHKHPQSAWNEFFATGFIAQKLSAWGYEVLQGKQIVNPEKRLFVPDKETIAKEYQLALDAGIEERFIVPASEGLTGVVGVLKGERAGPVVAFRFDIDGLEIQETDAEDHVPNRLGFASQHTGHAHMCGHDAHVATGLVLAQYLKENRHLIHGTVKLIFQPDEEKLSGAAAMVAAGVVDDVDYMIGGHVAANLWTTGQLGLNVHNILAVTRSQVVFKGLATHSTGRPDQGRNALLGACAAVTNLHAISRHGKGASMLNVGRLEGGRTWNIIPDEATLSLETRAVTSEINDYLKRRANDIIEGAARMYELDVEITQVVDSQSFTNDPELIRLGEQAAKTVPGIEEIVPRVEINASEDFAALAQAVYQRGGKVLYAIHGTPVAGGQHSVSFNLDEKVIINAANFYAALYQQITHKQEEVQK